MSPVQKGRSAAVVAFAIIAVFAQSLRAGFVWDDLPLVRDNDLLTRAGAWKEALLVDFWEVSTSSDALLGYWRPVVKLSHVLLRQLSASAFPFHLLNLVLHIGTSLLAMEWLRRRLATEHGDPLSRHAALAGALLFALHPSRFESVGWVSGSTELFFGFFTLAGLLLLDERKTYVLGMLALSLAMLSKETALVVPVLLGLDAALSERFRERRAAIALATSGIVICLAARVVIGRAFPHAPDSASGIERISRSLAAFASYHWRTLAPTEATFAPVDVALVAPGRFLIDPAWWLAGLALALGWTTLALLAWRRPSWRLWLCDGLWWLIPLAPVLWLVAMPSWVLASDRYLYLPVLGFSSMLARSCARWALLPERARATRLGLGGAALVSSALLTVALPSLKDNLAFFSREHELHPRNAIIIDNLGRALGAKGRYTAKQEVLARALDEAPLSPFLRAKFATSLAVAATRSTRDCDRLELAQLSSFFDALANRRPIEALELGTRRWALAMTPQTALELSNSQDGDALIATALTLRARRGFRTEAITAARQRWTANPSAANGTLLAHLLALDERWDEVALVLRSVPTGDPNAETLRALIADAGTPRSTDARAVALARARRLGRLGGAGRAREVLAPYATTSEGLKQPVLDARVQAELDDRCFEAALELLEQALRNSPGNPELLAAIEEVRTAAQAFRSSREAELQDAHLAP